MRIITRYLLREFIRPFVLILLSFDAMFLVFDLFDNVSKFIETDFPAWGILRYYLSLIASYSHWFAPASLMLATLYSMWMLSRNSEITAMRASGISFTELSMPFLGVALCVGALQGVNSEYIVPDAASWATRMKEQNFDVARIRSDPHTNFPFVSSAHRRQWFFQCIDTADAGTASVVTGEVSVAQEDAAGSNSWKIVATDGARFVDGQWWFFRPKVQHFDGQTQGMRDDEEVPSLEVLRMANLEETPRDIVLYTRNWENYSVADMRRLMATSGVESASRRFDICYRFASPWVCLVITLFAVPAGLTTARQSILKSIFTALGAFFGFYAMTHFCNFLGQGGYMPPLLAAWLPNLVFATIGIVNFRRLI